MSQFDETTGKKSEKISVQCHPKISYRDGRNSVKESLAIAEKALEFYADRENHYYHAVDCDLSKAVDALAQIKARGDSTLEDA